MNVRRRRSQLSERLRMSRIAAVPEARVVVPAGATPVGAPGLWAKLQGAVPAPGVFYQLAPGDTLSDIARQVLDSWQDGLGVSGPSRLAYMHCVTGGTRWNRRLYASPSYGTGFPQYTFVDGLGLRRAFSPWHDDARGRMRAGQWPERAVLHDRQGNRINGIGSSYGLLWLPDIQGFQYLDGYWIPICGELDPPKVLLDALRSPPRRTR
jgi:hypothetical protein